MEIVQDEQLKQRFAELADSCEKECRYTYTKFLGIAELEVFYHSTGLYRTPFTAFGGMEDCERKLVRFGSEETLYYTEDWPIACLCIRPLSQKFADDLSHRDVLGALMHLGVERTVLGDIFLKENVAYVFCLEEMADYLCRNLDKVRHTSVTCTRCPEVPALLKPTLKEELVQLAGERSDALVSKVYNLSRSESSELFAAGKILRNGRLCEEGSQSVKEGDVFSVRGYGRFIYRGAQRTTKKGKLCVLIDKYI